MGWIQSLHNDIINTDAVELIEIEQSSNSCAYFLHALLIDGDRYISHAISDYSVAVAAQKMLMVILDSQPIITQENINKIVNTLEKEMRNG